MRSLRCAAAASLLLAIYYTDTDLSWAWRAAGSASSRDSLPKLERLQRWCREYTYIRYTGSAAQSLLVVESAQGGITLHAAVR